MSLLEDTRRKFSELVAAHKLLKENIQVVAARPLKPEEVIGRPGREDFPLLKGKEVMLQAQFRSSRGQAFTDMPGHYEGTIQDVLNLPLENNFQRAVFVATLNAVMRDLNLVDRTVHCRDQEPEQCAEHLAKYIRERYGNPRIAFIGLQPAMVVKLSEHFPLRVVDLDPDNIGQKKGRVIVEDVSHTPEIIEWCDIIVATGTTAVNDTLEPLLGSKPVIFYGVTIAGIARLSGFERYCFCGH
ncbi:MAG: Rossmann-like domain-containing protein [Moorellaceae bacterium]